MRYEKGYTGVGEYTEDDIRIAKDIYRSMRGVHGTNKISVSIRKSLRCDGEKARVLMQAAKFYYDMLEKGMA